MKTRFGLRSKTGKVQQKSRGANVRGGYVFAVLLMHALALLAFLPDFFTWWGVASIPITNFIFGSLGINLAFHRLLTHRALEMPKWLERTVILCGVFCLEGSPLWWVLNHRIHHQRSDQDGDPHSPRKRFIWGHVLWIMTAPPERSSLSAYEKYVPDLLTTDPFLRWLHRGQKWLLVYIAHALVIAAVGLGFGYLVADTLERAVQIGAQVFLWGVVVRTVWVWHITWFVNSAAHRWGYQNYDTKDLSRNNWWVALLTNGEGWHNNHHAAPRSCSQGHKFWEIDLTFTFVRLLERVGLAWNIVPVKVVGRQQLVGGGGLSRADS